MRKPRGYAKKGFKMSRRGREAVRNNEHPVTYWQERLVMDEKWISKLLIYMGNHHVGDDITLIPFYRLPDKNDSEELDKIFEEFHCVPAVKLNFIRIMSMHLQKGIDEKTVSVPMEDRPRKKKKRRRHPKRKKSRRKNRILQRW
jgi:hypothetical protein